MKTKFAIGRHINGIFLNPLEYVLDSKGDVMQFDSEFDCEQFLRQHGASEDELQYFVFDPITHSD